MYKRQVKHKIAIGDTIRVATAQGQFESIVRRIGKDIDNDPTVNVIGVEFQKELKQKAKRGSVFSAFKGDARYQIGGGNGGAAASVLIVIAWLAIGLFAAACLIGFDNFPIIQDFVK